jgi:hypothetical protein
MDAMDIRNSASDPVATPRQTDGRNAVVSVTDLIDRIQREGLERRFGRVPAERYPSLESARLAIARAR